MTGGDPRAEPLLMSPKLAPDVAVRWAASLEDETTLLAAQLEHQSVDKTPTVISENFRVGHPARKQVALLGSEPAQVVTHGASLLSKLQELPIPNSGSSRPHDQGGSKRRT